MITPYFWPCLRGPFEALSRPPPQIFLRTIGIICFCWQSTTSLMLTQLALQLRVLPLRVLPVTQVASSAIRGNIVGCAAPKTRVNKTYMKRAVLDGPGCSRAAPFRGPPPPPPPASAALFFLASARFLFIAIMAAALPGISDLLRLIGPYSKKK